MPLNDLVRYLNQQLPFPPSGSNLRTPFVAENGRVYVRYGGVRLESAFSSIVEAANGALRGHTAGLQAFDTASRRRLDDGDVVGLPKDDNEFVFLDRLQRTLHVLNYLTYRDRRSRELLLLKVHSRHVASVAVDHGMVFEEILRSCGLMPEQITLEFDVGDGVNASHLARAIDNYRSRGYGIAIGRCAVRAIDFSWLSAIRPAIVRLDCGRPVEPLRDLVDHVHQCGALAMGDDAETPRHARASGLDLLQRSASAGPLPQSFESTRSPDREAPPANRKAA